MIPLLAIPVLNRPDLLRQTVASIDHPVRRLLIIDNSPDSSLWPVAQEAAPPAVLDLVVMEAPWNMGVAASWNIALKAEPREWVVLLNGDVRLGPGDLERLAGAMADPGPRVACLLEYAAFAVNAAAVAKAGYFDENFYPIYCEDDDHRWRCRLAGVPEVVVPAAAAHLEGGSVSYRSSERYTRANARTYPRNLDYFVRKWGGPPKGGERYSTPFDAGGPVGAWPVIPDHLTASRWEDPA